MRKERRVVHFRKQGRESVREGRDKALLLLAILEIKERRESRVGLFFGKEDRQECWVSLSASGKRIPRSFVEKRRRH